MKTNLTDIQNKILPIIRRIWSLKTLIFIVLLAVIYAFLIYRINGLNSQQPSDTDVAAKFQTVRRPNLDQSVITKIQQLQDNSVQVKSLFNSARKNPFNE